MSIKIFLPPVQATGAPAGSGQALPAGHAVQLSNFPPKEYIPAGHGTGGLLYIKQVICCEFCLYICKVNKSVTVCQPAA